MTGGGDAVGSVRIVVRGRVQGVWYRGWTVDTACALGLDGWVRNRRDGSVEILARGPGGGLEALAEACRGGPSAAQVTSVEVEAVAEVPAPGFQQVPTA